MGITVSIPEHRLHAYFDTFTKRFLRNESTDAVDVEVLSPDLGDQAAAQTAHLIGITYDDRENALELELDAGDHRIVAPKEVWTEEESDGFVRAIEVVRRDGVREIVRVKRLGLRRTYD